MDHCCPNCGSQKLQQATCRLAPGWRCEECWLLMPLHGAAPTVEKIYRLAAELRKQRFDDRRLIQVVDVPVEDDDFDEDSGRDADWDADDMEDED